MLDDDVRALLNGPNIGHLATLLKDGAPHASRSGSTPKVDQIAILHAARTARLRRATWTATGRVALSITAPIGR